MMSQQVRKMLSQLQQAFKGMIGDSEWTDRVTQRVTSRKVDAIRAEIGYPKIFETPDKLDQLFEYVRETCEIRKLCVVPF